MNIVIVVSKLVKKFNEDNVFCVDDVNGLDSCDAFKNSARSQISCDYQGKGLRGEDGKCGHPSESSGHIITRPLKPGKLQAGKKCMRG